MSEQLPPGARPIATDELLAAIGELYLQVRVLRQMVEAMQRRVEAGQASPNGVAGAVQQQP